jgi:hypothetical protein
MNNKNVPGCDGGYCRSNDPQELRVLPYSGDGNLILCRDCFNAEIHYRTVRNPQVWKPFSLPKWESLRVYEGGK